MTEAQIDLGLKVLQSAGVVNASYMPTAVTTGIREIALMSRLGLTDKPTLKREFSEQYRNEVFSANLEESKVRAERLRVQLSSRTVINPGSLDLPGASQEDYIRYWLSILGNRCSDIRLHDDCIFSSGCRAEISYALAAGIPIVHAFERNILSAADIQRLDDRARMDVVRRYGWTMGDTDRYMPVVDFGTIAKDRFEPGLVALEQFAAIVAKHNDEIRESK